MPGAGQAQGGSDTGTGERATAGTLTKEETQRHDHLIGGCIPFWGLPP